MPQRRPTRTSRPIKTPPFYKEKKKPSTETQHLAERLFRPDKYQPRTDGQRELAHAIDHNDIIWALGPSGSGKTYAAVGKAADAFSRGKIKRIVISRPYVGVGRSMGSLPGDADNKMLPFLKQLMEYFEDFYSHEQILSMAHAGEIEFAPMEFMRSRDFKRCWVIVDEVQNCIRPEIRVTLGRISTDSKLIFCGDIGRDNDGSCKQSDLPLNEQGGLEEFAERTSTIHGIAKVLMTAEDIVRHPLVKEMVRRNII